MDLKDFKPESNEVVLEIKNPIDKTPLLKDDGDQMKIVFFAPHTKEYKQAVYKQASKGKQKPDEIDFSKLDEASLELLCNIVKSWDIQIDNKEPECTPETVKEIFEDESLFWLRSDAEEAIASFQVFTKA